MAVGANLLYNSLIKPSAKEKAKQRGRSTYHIDKRNVLLCYRYYYYTYIKKKLYEGALEALEVEFFITENTIIKCLSTDHAQLQKIFEDKPTLNDLKKLYEWLVWN